MTDSNIAFYENIKLEKFKELAVVTGFDKCPDLKLIYEKYIADAQILVELGMGYGRCMDFLIEKQFQGTIYAVERVKTYLDNYRKHKYKKIKFLHEDIRYLNLPKKADVVLWMWSGILEQNKPTQRHCIEKIYTGLREGGYLIIEVPQDKIKFVGKKLDEHYIRVETEWGILEAYLPHKGEIREIAEDAGYSSFETLEYNSDTGLNRVMYILKK